MCAFFGVLFGLAALHEEPPGWSGLVVTRDLPAGHILAPGDVATVGLSSASQPSNAVTSTAEANGRVLAGPMVSGETLLESRLVGPGILDGGPPGHVAMPLRLEDPAEASFLNPGDRVDVLAARRTAELAAPGDADAEAPNTSAELIARDVLVLATPGVAAAGAATMLGSESAGAGGASVLVVSVSPSQATAIAGAAANARLSVVLRAA